MKRSAAALLAPLVLAVHAAVAAGALLVLSPLWLLPWATSRRLGRLYGLLAFALWPSARRVAAVNLRRAYGPSMTPGRARSLTARSLGSLGEAVAEAAQLFRRHRSGTSWEELYEAEDPALEARLLADPRPKVVVTGHLGSWEVAAFMLSRRSPGGAGVFRRIDNPFLDRLVARVRSAASGAAIEKRGAVTEALSRLRQGHGVLLLLDENGGHRGTFVPFFGRDASTRKTAALLSALTGAPIVVAAAVRRPGRSPFLFRLAAVEPPAGRRATPADVRAMTREATAVWERWVRDDPDQWRWVHWRWKTRPDGTEETYGRADVAAAFEEPGAAAAPLSEERPA